MIDDKGLLAAQFLKLRCRDSVSEDEEEALGRACSGAREFPAHHVLVHERDPQTNSHLLLEGVICRQITMEDGRRQIVAIHVPGDFVDLHSFLLGSLEHNVESLTPVRIAVFPHSELRNISETHPHLARLLWLSTLLDAALHREWVLSVGRRTAKERVAHLFCELYERMRVVRMVKDLSYALPLSQTDIADACALTSVHVSRTLRLLREEGLVEFKSKQVLILDYERLAEVASFDPFYLHLGASER